jgi:hypothetical protein
MSSPQMTRMFGLSDFAIGFPLVCRFDERLGGERLGGDRLGGDRLAIVLAVVSVLVRGVAPLRCSLQPSGPA